MITFRGQAGWVKMMSLGGKLTALACHRTKSKQSLGANLSFHKNLKIKYLVLLILIYLRVHH